MAAIKDFTDLDWTFGLIHANGRYLTAENFGFRINATGSSLKKRNIFALVAPDGPVPGLEGKDGAVFIKTHLNKYLAINGDGKLSGNTDEPDNECGFIIEAQPDGSWALKSAAYGWYLGGGADDLSAFVTEISQDRLWTVHLAMHPHVTIRNLKRRRYLHLSDDQSSITTDEDIPWGHDAVLEVAFNPETKGTNLKTSNGSCLSSTGALLEQPDASCDFILEFSGKDVSFKSTATGKYLTSLGSTGLAKASKSSISDDERFTFGNSFPQIKLKASNGSLLSVKQGVEVAAMAAADEPETDAEIFQLEPLGNGKWFIKSHSDKLFTLTDGGIHATTPPDSASEANEFEIKFDGKDITIKANDGKYVKQQMNRYLKAASTDDAEDACKFEWTMVNRPRIVLRSTFGFAYTTQSGKMECNRAVPEAYNFAITDGKCSIQSSTGGFVKVGEDGVVSANSAAPDFFYVELFEYSKMKIKTEDGRVFRFENNGAITCVDSCDEEYTLFQY